MQRETNLVKMTLQCINILYAPSSALLNDPPSRELFNGDVTFDNYSNCDDDFISLIIKCHSYEIAYYSHNKIFCA